MKYNSNFPGIMIVKIGPEVEENVYEVSASFNEIARFNAGDGLVYLFDNDNKIKIPLEAEPASHEVVFGEFTLVYSDDNARIAVIGGSD